MFEKFKTGFGKDTKGFKDVGVPLMKTRMVKTKEELDLYKETAKIADIGGFAAKKAMKEGAHEHEVAAAGKP